MIRLDAVDRDFQEAPEHFSTLPWVVRIIGRAVHHQHLEAKAAPCAPSRDARGSCRWNCAGTCKQQSDGLKHHI